MNYKKASFTIEEIMSVFNSLIEVKMNEQQRLAFSGELDVESIKATAISAAALNIAKITFKDLAEGAPQVPDDNEGE